MLVSFTLIVAGTSFKKNVDPLIQNMDMSVNANIQGGREKAKQNKKNKNWK